MRNKKRMLAAGLISAALLSAVTGCGSASGNVQDIQSIQGTAGAAGGTVQGSASAENASDTASQNNSNTLSSLIKIHHRTGQRRAKEKAFDYIVAP